MRGMMKRCMAAGLALVACAAAHAETKLFAAIMTKGPNWVDGKIVTEQDGFEQHRATLRALDASGALLLAGPFAGWESGMTIVRADSLEAARAMLEADGFIASGVLSMDLHEWEASMGAVDPSVAFALAQPAPDAMRTLTHDAVINAPVAEVWAAFTTGEGYTALGVPKAEVDLRVGGSIRSSYNPESSLNDDDTIVNTILAYAPERMLAMRNTQAPANFPLGPALQKTWSVTTLEPLGPDATRVSITGYGWGDDPASQQAYTYFKQGNQIVLDTMKAALEGDTDAEALAPNEVMERIGMLAGGEWIAEKPMPGGGTFRVRGVTRFAPDGASLVSRGWLGTDEGMWEHATTQVWLDPVLGTVRFQNIDESGAVARGEIVGLDTDHLRWDWNLERPDGSATRYRVEMLITGPDAYTFELFAPTDDGGWQMVQTTDNRRVDTAPAAFLKMREGDQAMGAANIEEWTDGAVRVLAHRGEGDARWSEFEVTLPEARDAAWARLTTEKGLQSFFAPKANVELREGGTWEPLFFPDAAPGQRGAEGVYIRSIDAPRTLQVHWNAPPQFPEVRATGFRAHFVLEPIDHATTRVTLRLDEFGEGEQWDGTYDYFLQAFPVVLNRMRRATIDGPIDWAAERSRASR
ncbi:MAG: SRPBCC domain-containing protein [Phycisphaerales bacterium]